MISPSPMLYVVLIFLWLSVLLYLLLGGADFGAGVLELFSSGKARYITRKTMHRVIGPIWEANHMWLIIAIVILFVGFPAIYTTASVYLHIPLVVMLMGIVARGTAFSFRNYDAVQDEMQTIYSRIFVYASVITPLFLGIIAGTIVSGQIDSRANSFAGAFIFDWLNWFPLSVGLFTVFICAYLASVYLIGETDKEEEKRYFITRTRNMNIGAFASGALVFLAARTEGIPLAEWIFGNSISAIAIISAFLSLIVFWFLLYKSKPRWLRVIAAFQVTMLFVAVTYSHFPNIMLLRGGGKISLMDAVDGKTIGSLGWALLIGSLFILPAFLYLLYTTEEKDIGATIDKQK
jgi:cytochrome d ubiquinol oxidase subunit II